MEVRELKKRLRNLGKTANQHYPALNLGGCCVFAAAVATELERLGVEHEVITLGKRTFNLHENRPKNNTMEDWEWSGADFGHVGVRMKLNGRWHTYDSDALLRRKYTFGFRGYTRYGNRWTAAGGGLTAKEATELADTGEWNKTFYTLDNVQGVRQLVKEAFQ